MPPRTRVAGSFALTVLLLSTAACGPTPTPSAAGPAERFLATVTSLDRNLAAAIEGSYTLTASETYPVWGALAIDGADSRTLTTLEGPFGIDAWEQFVREGQVSTRRGIDPWTEPTPVAEPQASLPGALASLTAVDDLGTETIDGQILHHVRAEGLPITPQAFGIESASADPSATLEAWLADDGTPIRMRLTSGPMTLDLEPIHMTGAIPIPEPPALAVLQSPALRYALVHPEGADVSERGTSGHLIGLEGAYLITYCAAGSMPLNAWVTEGTTLYNTLWEAEPESVEPLVVEAAGGPVPGTLSTWHGTVEGREAYILDLAIVADGVACDVQWFSPPGNEAADRARFEQLMAGFRLGG
jgi:hypothetical protein